MKRAAAAKPAQKPIAAAVTPAAPAPAVLLKYQQDWVNEKADVAVWEKSRRIGASWCDAAAAVLTAAAQTGQDALYIGYAQDMTRGYIEDCAMWAKAFNQVAGEIEETIFLDTEANGRDPKEIKAIASTSPLGTRSSPCRRGRARFAASKAG